jgi:hypothetical protein
LPSERRGGLGDAVRRIAAKHAAADTATREIIDAARHLPPTEVQPLLVIVAGLGGEAAFAALDEMLRLPAAEARLVAAKALGSWRDLRVGEALMRVAQEDADEAIRTAAVKSATTVYSRGVYGTSGQVVPERIPEAIAGLRKTWTLAPSAVEKDAVIVALRGLKDERATKAARELEQGPAR